MSTVDRDVVMRELDVALVSLSRCEAARYLSSVVGVPVLDALRGPIFQSVVEAARGGARRSTPVARRLVYKAGDWARGEVMHGRWRADVRVGDTSSILVLPRMATDVRQLAPLVRELKRRRVPVKSVAHDRASFRTAVRGGLDVRLGPRVAGARVRGLVAELRARLGVWRSAPSVGGLDGQVVAALVRDQVVTHLWDVAVVAAQTRAMCAVHPQWVIVGNDLSLHGRTAVLAARQLGVRTAVLIHGLTANNPTLGYYIADRIFVWGSEQRDALVRYGIDERRIVVSGAPFLDERPMPASSLRDDVARATGLNEPSGYLLLALSGPGERVSRRHHEAIIAAAAAAAAHLGIPLVAKLHPKDSRSFYETAGVRTIPSDVAPLVDTWQWISASACVLTAGSTIALEAMTLRIPVVHLDLTGELREVDYARFGAARVATDHPTLCRAVEESIRFGPVPASDEYVRAKLGELDGKASSRIADVLSDSLFSQSDSGDASARTGEDHAGR